MSFQITTLPLTGADLVRKPSKYPFHLLTLGQAFHVPKTDVSYSKLWGAVKRRNAFRSDVQFRLINLNPTEWAVQMIAGPEAPEVAATRERAAVDAGPVNGHGDPVVPPKPKKLTRKAWIEAIDVALDSWVAEFHPGKKSRIPDRDWLIPCTAEEQAEINGISAVRTEGYAICQARVEKAWNAKFDPRVLDGIHN